LRLQLASVVFWQNRPRQARQLAEDGLRYLQDGPNAAHLHVKYARAAARLGDAEAARQAITQHSPQARGVDERIEEFGQEAIAAELHSLSGGMG
jgi:phage terminase Nu1 subunit (DNA packaging protein)